MVSVTIDLKTYDRIRPLLVTAPFDLRAYKNRWYHENKERLRESINAQAKASRAKNLERIKARQREYRSTPEAKARRKVQDFENKGRINELKRLRRAENIAEYRERERRYYAADPQRYKDACRSSQSKWRPEQYVRAVEEQRGLCAICGHPPDGRGFNADHDRETNKPRALLCSNCNTGIGFFGEDAGLLGDAAPGYLRRAWAHAVGPREELFDQSERGTYRRTGWMPVAYKFALIEQRGLCAICGRPPTGRWPSLAADHCHATGSKRGLLCHHCNLGLGRFDDSVERLHEAAAYVERWRLEHGKALAAPHPAGAVDVDLALADRAARKTTSVERVSVQHKGRAAEWYIKNRDRIRLAYHARRAASDP